MASLLVGGTVYAGTQLAGTSELKLGSDLYLAGENVDVNEDAAGDVVAAGGSVRVAGNVPGDLIVFARSATIDGNVAGSVRGAVQFLNINGSVDGRITVAAMELNLNEGNQATATSLATMAGTVTVDRPLNGYAVIFGQTASLNSKIDGPVKLALGSLSVGEAASFPSGVTFQKVANDLAANQAIDSLRKVAQVTVLEPTAEAQPSAKLTEMATSNLLVAVQLLAFGLIMYWLLPKAMVSLEEAHRGNKWLNVMFGVFGLPFYLATAIAFIITVLLMPVGIAMLLVSPIIFGASYLALVNNIGRRLTKEKQNTVVSLSVGLLLIYILNLIPVVNLFTLLIMFVLTVGGFWQAFFKRMQILK